MVTKEITDFLEDEAFYDKWKEKIQITLTLEELQVIITALDSLKEKYKQELEETKNVVENGTSDLVKDIEFTESLHSDLVDTLYYETDK